MLNIKTKKDMENFKALTSDKVYGVEVMEFLENSNKNEMYFVNSPFYDKLSDYLEVIKNDGEYIEYLYEQDNGYGIESTKWAACLQKDYEGGDETIEFRRL